MKGLLRDKTRPSRIPALSLETVALVVARTHEAPPGDLQAAINRFLTEHNESPKPFVWTADPDKIIAAVRRGHQVLDSIH